MKKNLYRSVVLKESENWQNVFRVIICVLFILLFTVIGFSNPRPGAIKVTVLDKSTKEAVPFANVVLFQAVTQVSVANTNLDGECLFKNLKPGTYTVKSHYVGYRPSVVKGVVVGEGKTAYLNVQMKSDGVSLCEVVCYQIPLADPDTKSGQTVTREDYANMPVKNINSVAATTYGVSQTSGAILNARGSRATVETNESILAGKLTASELNDFRKWEL